MGFLKSRATDYPARRNRMPQPSESEADRRQNHHPATVIPPSNYGAQDPSPIPARIYQASGTSVQPPTGAAPVMAAAAAPFDASQYGAFPGGSAPVQATVYVPGQNGAGATSGVAPVVATAFAPGSAQAQFQAAVPVQASTSVPVQASAPPSSAYGPPGGAAGAHATPAMNPLYQNQQPSFNNGNSNYNSDESSFWECSVCTFPNLRTEANCKGCGSPIPPGMLRSAACAAAAHQATSHNGSSGAVNAMNAQMNNLSVAGGGGGTVAIQSGVMRVHVPDGMRPGQKIKVRSPDGREVVKAIPPRDEWRYDEGGRLFFRMQFGPQAATVAPGVSQAHEVPPPHSTSWRNYRHIASAQYSPPPLATRSVPHAPRGGGGIPPNGRHKSLIIGINYTGTRAQLRGCINDARSMQGLLRRNGFPDDGAHMLLLTDERSRGGDYQPTVDNIMKAFRWLMNDVRKGDVLFFHFSGHGGQVPDKTGHEIDGYNETIIPLDHDRKGQISDDVLWGSLVYNLPEGARMTALMDMCHSGTGLDLPYDYNVNNRRWSEDVNPAHSAGDVVLFSGCEDSQTSADVSGGGGKLAGGAMTRAFTEAYQMQGAGTYHEFLSAVKRQLKKNRFKQRPQLTSSQQFDADSRIFSLGYQSGGPGGIPSIIEPNHNPHIGRQKRRHVRPARRWGGGGGGGGADLFGIAGAAIGAALIADALF